MANETNPTTPPITYEVSLTPEPTSEVTFAIACDGEITFKDDTDSYHWEDICSRDFAIFCPGASFAEVADYFDALGIKGDDKGELLEQIFC